MTDEVHHRRSSDTELGILIGLVSTLHDDVQALKKEVSELKSLRNQGVGIFLVFGIIGSFIMANWKEFFK
jgi:hypothetical protein